MRYVLALLIIVIALWVDKCKNQPVIQEIPCETKQDDQFPPAKEPEHIDIAYQTLISDVEMVVGARYPGKKWMFNKTYLGKAVVCENTYGIRVEGQTEIFFVSRDMIAAVKQPYKSPEPLSSMKRYALWRKEYYPVLKRKEQTGEPIPWKELPELEIKEIIYCLMMEGIYKQVTSTKEGLVLTLEDPEMFQNF